MRDDLVCFSEEVCKKSGFGASAIAWPAKNEEFAAGGVIAAGVVGFGNRLNVISAFPSCIESWADTTPERDTAIPASNPQ
jgi:hypothetical protein